MNYEKKMILNKKNNEKKCQKSKNKIMNTKIKSIKN